MEDFQERASRIASAVVEEGPEAFFRELDEMLPDPVREQVSRFPLTAVLVGFGVGVYLGFKKSEELFEIGTGFITATATANLSKAFGND